MLMQERQNLHDYFYGFIIEYHDRYKLYAPLMEISGEYYEDFPPK